MVDTWIIIVSNQKRWYDSSCIHIYSYQPTVFVGRLVFQHTYCIITCLIHPLPALPQTRNCLSDKLAVESPNGYTTGRWDRNSTVIVYVPACWYIDNNASTQLCDYITELKPLLTMKGGNVWRVESRQGLTVNNWLHGVWMLTMRSASDKWAAWLKHLALTLTGAYFPVSDCRAT